MKIYKNKKDGSLTIVFSRNEDTGITLVHDRGTKNLKNMFGGKVSRYVYHCADAHGDSGHATYTDETVISKDDVSCKLKKRTSK